MSQFTIFRSTDSGAPILSGGVGTLARVLDGCLVNGYGSMTGVGWTCPYSGTNRRIYQQGGGSSGLYRLNDNASGLGGAKEALFRGGEVATGVDSITSGAFPTAAQITLTDNSLILRKSASADTSTRAWMVFADNKTCIIFLSAGDTAGTYSPMYIGDEYSLVPGDLYAGLIIGKDAENAGSFTNDRFTCMSNVAGSAWANVEGHFFQRGWAGTGGSCPAVKLRATFVIGTTADGTWEGYLNYPNGADGGLWLHRILLGDLTTNSTKNVRGWMRGCWFSAHASSNFTDGDIVSGTGPLVGRSFLVIKTLQGVGGSTCLFIETSNTVE